MNTCCNCGKDFEAVFECWNCETCHEWGITRQEMVPTIMDVFSEQYHRIGKDGQKYWGKLGGGILFTNGKQVLLLKRDGDCDFVDHWSIPGGKAKENEKPIETAHREAKEECGKVEGNRFGQFHDRDGQHHFHTFLHSVSKPFDVTLSKEHSDSKWVDINDVDSLKLHPKFKESWPSFLRMIKQRFPAKTSFFDWFTTRIS